MALNITWKGSPNKDGANFRTPIDRIVIHWFGVGTLESANNRFQTAGQASAHYGISGKTIWQWVKEEEVAWHAGVYSMNQRSIGIEYDATTSPDASPHDLSEESYKTSAALVKEIAKRHNIPLDRQHIIGHKEVKATQCPGTINIDKLISLAKGESTPTPPADDFGRIVKKATQWDRACSKDEGFDLGDPNHTMFETLKSFVAGVRSRVTDLENQLNGKNQEIATANQEVKNLEDKVANVERECQTQLKVQKDHYEAQIGNIPNLEKLVRQHEGTITDLQGRLREAEKAKGLAEKELAACKADNQDFETGKNALQTLIDLFLKFIKIKK